MIKDRLQELKQNAYEYDEGESISLINHFAIIDMEEPFMGDFFNKINTLRSTVNKITELIDDVEHLQHAMHTSQIVVGTKEKLEEKMAEIKHLGNHVRMALKQMRAKHEMRNTSKKKDVRQRIIESQIDATTKYFCTTMDKYYQSVITDRERCKIQIARQIQLKTGIEINDNDIEEILRKGRLNLFPEIIIETQQATKTLNEMELRHHDLLELENSILELHYMLLDFTYQIYSQNDPINSIKDKTSHSEDDIEQFSEIGDREKISYCFNLKLSTKKFASSLVLKLSRLFSSCV